MANNCFEHRPCQNLENERLELQAVNVQRFIASTTGLLLSLHSESHGSDDDKKRNETKLNAFASATI